MINDTEIAYTTMTTYRPYYQPALTSRRGELYMFDEENNGIRSIWHGISADIKSGTEGFVITNTHPATKSDQYARPGHVTTPKGWWD